MGILNQQSYFMEIAKLEARRSTVSSQQDGAVITENKKIISTGHIHMVRGYIVHAEVKAIISANEKGEAIYCTTQPCIDCLKLIVITGIRYIYYLNENTQIDLRNNLRKGILARSFIKEVKF